MSQKLSLQRIRNWPRWIIIPIGLALAGLAILLGLFLESAADALSPVKVEPTPTMPTIAYSQGTSDGCHDCHFSLDALQASALDPGTAETYFIEAESIVTTHGKLGCLACHGGDGEAADKEAAHQGLVADMSAQDPEKCIICHQDLPNEFPNDRLRLPHGEIIRRIQAGDPCDVHCSDCHGGVGHGFDPVSGDIICSMTVCLDCHQERNLEIQMADCDACHLGPHDVPTSLTCSGCHTSTEVWAQVDPGVHPVPLLGEHAETDCFQCHQYPNFQGVSNVCADCHESGHTEWGDGDCAGCHDPGTTWDMTASTWDGHAEHWNQYKGQHLKVSCKGCHFEGYADVDPGCDTCHSVPKDHDDGRSEAECTGCHQADQPWTP
ncbi:MAG: hypothetical protein PVH17_05005 [Anaerolineae bacterium]|jgi:hypothetical protein